VRSQRGESALKQSASAAQSTHRPLIGSHTLPTPQSSVIRHSRHTMRCGLQSPALEGQRRCPTHEGIQLCTGSAMQTSSRWQSLLTSHSTQRFRVESHFGRAAMATHWLSSTHGTQRPSACPGVIKQWSANREHSRSLLQPPGRLGEPSSPPLSRASGAVLAPCLEPPSSSKLHSVGPQPTDTIAANSQGHAPFTACLLESPPPRSGHSRQGRSQGSATPRRWPDLDRSS
jgi:hypothetical protein